MEAATRNAESPQPLPLFRPEALAARQKIQGEALFIRSFSWLFFLGLIAILVAICLVFPLLAHYEPRVKVSGSLSPSTGEAIFFIPPALGHNIRPGSAVALHCERCGFRVFQPGTITRMESLEDSDGRGSRPDASAATYRIAVAIAPFNSREPGGARLQPGAKLEAEFPLQSRPLMHWLIGAAAE